jgi:hypothetical protein
MTPPETEGPDAHRSSTAGTTETQGDPAQGAGQSRQKRTWVEEVEVAGNQLVDRIKELVQDSTTTRVILRTQDGFELISVPLTVGVVAGGILTLAAPLLAALGAIAALVSKVKLEVIREEEGPGDPPPPASQP